MKKELAYIQIKNSLGWNQNWFTDWSMYGGGCGAVTACDLCLHLAQQKGLAQLYPYSAAKPTKKEYHAFSKIMKPHLSPRWQGIDRLDIYIDGLASYCRTLGQPPLWAEGLEGTASLAQAIALVRQQIDDNIPIPFLLLHHKNRAFRDYQWHWFNLAGYKEAEGQFYVKAVTYGSFCWLDLAQLWDTGYKNKGGMVAVYTKNPLA